MWKYKLKELVKLTSGFYNGGIFQSDFMAEKIDIYDRYQNGKLKYQTRYLKDGLKYYIGQPLIEDGLITEHQYIKRLTSYFESNQLLNEVIYLAHPREEERQWISEIFRRVDTNESAETYLTKHGAGAIYSAFSTVNINVECERNVFLAKTLGLQFIAERLQRLNFHVRIV